MTLQRMDNVGLELEGRATIEGDWAERVTGLHPMRVEIAMMRPPDGQSRLEIARFLTPVPVAGHRNAPVNALGYLRIMFAVDDIDETLARLRQRGAQLRLGQRPVSGRASSQSVCESDPSVKVCSPTRVKPCFA
jgi:catechol 2,3-dioxygenase-like lactoylglutathione lyase family enzyme